MPTPIPDKGRVLTQLSLFWFNLLSDVIPNHVLSATEFPAPFDNYRGRTGGALHGRAQDQALADRMRRARLLVRLRLERIPSHGKNLRHCAAAGLRESDKLPEPIFTPATKATTGHDENIPFERAAEMLGEDLAEKVRAVTLEIYRRAAAYAEPRGILLADTKFEFGLLQRRIDLD